MFNEIKTEINNLVSKVLQSNILIKIDDKINNLDKKTIRLIRIGGAFILIGTFLLVMINSLSANHKEGTKGTILQVTSIYRGSGKEALVRPLDAVSDESGNLYVADSSHHRIVVFSVDGKVENIIGKEGTHAGELNYPTAVAIKDDRLYVADSSNGRIMVFDTDGEFISQINSLKQEGKTKEAEANLNSNENEFKPINLTIDSNGDLFVSDGLGQRILVFNKDGKLLRKFGSPGSGHGQFAYPNGIALDEKNKRIFVADFANSRVQVLTWDGKYKYELKGEGLFMNPRGLAYDTVGDRLFVSDIFNHRITVLNGNGQALGFYGEIGSSLGKFHFPNGLFFYENNLYVTDRENNRVVLVKVNKK